MFTAINAGLSHEPIAVDSPPVNVARQQSASVLVRPAVAEVDHRVTMRVAAAVLLIARSHPASFVPRAGCPMQMVARRRHRFIDVWIRMHAPILPAFVVSTGHQMPEMLHDARRQKPLTVIVKIESPRIDCSIGDDFKRVSSRMVSPDATAKCDTLFCQSPWSSNMRWLLNSVSTVEPAVWPPRQPIHAVMFGLERPAIEMHNHIAIRHVVTISIRNKRQIRRSRDPDSTKPNLQPGQMSQPVTKYFPRVKHAISGCVLKNQNPIVSFVSECAAVVRVALSNPQSPSIVERDCDRLPNIWLSRRQRDLKTVRHMQLLDRFSRSQRAFAICLRVAGSKILSSGNTSRTCSDDK